MKGENLRTAMDNMADWLCFAVWKTMTTMQQGLSIDPAAILNTSRPYSDRGSSRLESTSSSSLWPSAPHVIGPPTTEMTNLPPLEFYFITQTHQSVLSLLYDSGEAHTLRLSFAVHPLTHST